MISLGEISTPAVSLRRENEERRPLFGCERWQGWRFLLGSTEGEFRQLAPVRCSSPNKCEYCAKLTALENAEMLKIDGQRAMMTGRLPELYCVLTTRTESLDMKVFSRGLEKSIKAIRRRWRGCQYVSLLEYTTGRHEGRGRRFPHWNLLIKGVPREAQDELREIAVARWCEHVDARPAAQHVGPVESMGGLIKYVALHFEKVDQRPPPGFTGKRFNPSRGYWEDGRKTPELREAARERIMEYRLEQAGRTKLRLEGQELHDWVTEQLANRPEDWSVITHTRDRWGEWRVSVVGGTPLHIDRGDAADD